MLNKFQGIGRLGADVEIKYTPTGTAIAEFSVAMSKKFKGKDGNTQEKTTWANVKAFKQLAELCSNYIKKGSQVYFEGEMDNSSWEKDGKKYYKTEIIADKVIFLDPPDKSDVKPKETKAPAKKSNEYKGFTSDDIPF